jgi:GNAT superfamily N-acetyltransferase
MSELDIREVSTDAENEAFLRLPWEIYADDPNRVAPLWRDHVRFFDPEYNIELRHIDLKKYVAWRGDKPVGTIIAHINHHYNDFQEENTGWFGQFEILEDREAAHGLLAAAEAWLRERGVDRMMGPATFSTNSELGLLIDGFDTPPMILMSHARPYYQAFVESYPGVIPEMDLWAWHFDGNDWGGRKADKLPERLTRIVNKIRKRRNFTLRNADLRHFDREIAIVKRVYNQAWAKNWGFVPFTDEEIDHVAEELKAIIDPRVTFVVEVEGEPIAFGLPLPNIYEPLHKVRSKPGEPHWWQLLRLLWHWKIAGGISSIRAWALGVLDEYRGSGVDALLYYELIKEGLTAGYLNIEMSWILANNDMMNRAIQMLGAEVYKTYRIYEKPFTSYQQAEVEGDDT